jgi:hypothetical protein
VAECYTLSDANSPNRPEPVAECYILSDANSPMKLLPISFAVALIPVLSLIQSINIDQLTAPRVKIHELTWILVGIHNF